MPREGIVSNGLESHSDSHHQQQSDEDALDEVCQQWGFEYVDFEACGRNDYGEPVGMERVREALEANDWDNSGVSYCDYEEEEDGEGDDTGDGGASVDQGVLGKVAGEFEEEMFGLRKVIEAGETGSGIIDWDNQGLGLDRGREWDIGADVDEDDETQGKQVEEMESLMHRLAMLRDLEQDDDKIKSERQKLAAKLLREVMEEEEAVEGVQSSI